MKWIFRPRGLRPQLMLAFFMLGLVPFLVVTLFFLYSHGKDLTTQTSNHLVSVRNIKKSQLEDYFGNLKEQIINFSQQDFAGNSIGRFYGFTGAFEKLGTTPQEARARALFALTPEHRWNEERVLERYELLYEARLVAEAWRDADLSPTQPMPGRIMSSDHRRILATALDAHIIGQHVDPARKAENFQLGAQVDLVIVAGGDPVFHRLTVLAHHNNWSLQSRNTG